jgi:hypothetical protein
MRWHAAGAARRDLASEGTVRNGTGVEEVLAAVPAGTPTGAPVKINRLPRLVAFLSLAAAAACSNNEPAPSPQSTPYVVRMRVTNLVPTIVDRSDAAASEASSLGHVLRTGLQIADVATRGATPNLGNGKAPDVPISPDAGVPHLRQLGVAPLIASIARDDLRSRWIRVWLNTTSGGPNTGAPSAPTGTPTTPPQIPTPDTTPGSTRGQDTAQWLNDNLFADANYADGAFRVPPALVCGSDTTCAQKIADAHLAIVATPTGRDGLDLSVVTGLDRAPALTISLAPDVASFDLDLAKLAPVLQASLDPSADATHGLLLEASGEVAGSMAAWTDDDVTADLSIEVPVHVALHPATIRTNDAVLSLDLAASDSALSFHLDGPHAQTITRANVGQIAVHVPASADGKTPGKLAVLPALQGVAITSGGKPVEIEALSFGTRPATISVDGAVAASLEINPNDGHQVGLSIETEADTGAVVLEASPRLDVAMSIDWAKLGESAPDTWITRALLDGAGGANGAVRIAGDQLEVVAGQLTTHTAPVDQGGTFGPGQCLSRGIAITCLAMGN